MKEIPGFKTIYLDRNMERVKTVITLD